MDQGQLDADILVVDDEPGIRSGVTRVLAARGARVDIAASGAEAVERLSSNEFDVAIVDLVMPSFGGMEVLDRMAEAGIEAVPIVITAHASIETAIEAVKRGAFDYLPKPFVPLELIVRVERALKWRRLRQEAARRLLELDTDKTRLRAIVNSLADGVLVVNVDNQVVLSNPAARAALGFEGHTGEPRAVEDVIRDPGLLGLVRSAAADPATATAFTTELRVADKTYMARVVPIGTDDGDVLGTATVLRDVTELMSLERAKAQFMSMVAHELKAPLAAVQGFLRVILAGQELPPEKLHDLVARCSERVEGMTQLVRDLLELTRADAMPMRRIEPLNLAEIVAQIMDANEQLAADAQVTLRAEIPSDLPPVYADRDDMSRMVGNLVSNAIKYNRPGGTVLVRANHEGARLQIDVVDTGLGIPQDALARLGDEFFRINLPDRRGIVGTGLGLSLVKRAVEAYHGRLEVQSTLGQGSTFSLVLPICADTPEQGPQ
jgi:two-component system phosphate regulon sensor histidine kinase PhoR